MDAAIALEDPGFASHRGFITQAYRNSLEDNIKLGRFHRGGSTITMQLAKNLWLRRDKTLGRKAQEFFLAQAIESCYTKDKIIELYLNVVEYGPDLYGIGGAARHYFKVTPSQLKPVEAFWLMSILPHPRKAGTPDAATLDRTRKFMDTLMKNGRIPDTYLDDVGQPDDSEWGHQL
jgi:membrane peptidoglycan carboxypeptidase